MMPIIPKTPFDQHPTVRRVRQAEAPAPPSPLTLAALRALAIEAGADEVGAVSLEHPEVAEERAPVIHAFPATRTLVSLIIKMHPDNVRSPARSVANREFHHAGEKVDLVAREVVERLAALGHRAINPSMAFPMEMDDFPGRTWIVSHKRVAVAAQLGRMLEEVAESRDRQDLRERVSISETASMWQSLAYKPNYKAAHCIAVCPAGEEVMAPFVRDRPAYLKDIVRPLTERTEPVYVVQGSDAQAHVAKRFPHKPVRVVKSSLRPSTPEGFFRAIPLSFQRGPAKGWRGTFHFDLTGKSGPVRATVRVNDGQLEVEHALTGTPDVQISGDGPSWIELVTGRRSALRLVLTRKLSVRGDRSLLSKFAACFPR